MSNTRFSDSVIKFMVLNLSDPDQSEEYSKYLNDSNYNVSKVSDSWTVKGEYCIAFLLQIFNNPNEKKDIKENVKED